ncbi:MAG: DUF4178 domain-containing protein [Bacillota bacterium]
MSIFDLFKRSNKQKPVKRNFFNIQVGDVVTYDDRDYIVSQVLEYNEGGYKWLDYQLVDGDDELWLGVDDDDGLELSIYEEIDLALNDLPKEISYNGEVFYREEKSRAKAVNRSDYTDTKYVDVEYADYENEGGTKYLSVEKWNSEIEVSLGYPIKQYEVKILPKD